MSYEVVTSLFQFYWSVNYVGLRPQRAAWQNVLYRHVLWANFHYTYVP